ncbi:serine/threonine-protein kinase [Neorhodopirellula pilleata]|uniref:Serine/threonine-protein kinase PK-1 n=1 Tax=Neorhodopirellula pilleata TaxID=2714738 RepID=A0A5C6AUI5_9BACT|nr:serine/threonine-protein kinase [Neorhodopirellula pilleata]TWU03137.1 Serine/threonine-protein kinase PK-1 [Neorhodopirellula pilleata]
MVSSLSNEPIDDDSQRLELALMELASIAPVENLRQIRELIQNIDPNVGAEGTQSQPLIADSRGVPVVQNLAIELIVELIKMDLSTVFEVAAETSRPPVRELDDYLNHFADWLPRNRVPLSLVLEYRQCEQSIGRFRSWTDESVCFPHLSDHFKRFADAESPREIASNDHDTDEQVARDAIIHAMQPGEVMDDFEIIRRLGKGSFASVYLARQQSMARLVALKLSRRRGNESRTLAKFDHPHIVRVFDERQAASSPVSLLYMEYLAGGTLGDVVKRVRETRPEDRCGTMLLAAVDQNLLDAAQQIPAHSQIRDFIATADWTSVVAWIGVQLSQGLQAAHQEGVLHRDLKPANVLLSAEGQVKLADFNVSVMTQPDTSSTSDQVGGSIAYMAPEHIEAMMRARGTNPTATSSYDDCQPDVGTPADLYSVGVLLWELWRGERPFSCEDDFESQDDMLQAHWRSRQLWQADEFDTHDRAINGSDSILHDVLTRCLDVVPSRRPADGAELAGRLRLALCPRAARFILPPHDSWDAFLSRQSVWLVAMTAILVPNIAAAIFNFYYNHAAVIASHPGMKTGFFHLASVVNAVAFPIGAAAMVVTAFPVARSMKRLRLRVGASPKDLNRLMELPPRAAWIGLTLWMVAALIYPGMLSGWYGEFSKLEALHFFGSLLVCGGVAAVYPFFALTVLCTRVYYPAMVRHDVRDDSFDWRGRLLLRRCGHYLFLAAGIPLLAILLLLSRESMARPVVAIAVVATGCGLLAAWLAHGYVMTVWDTLADVLSNRRRSIPGLRED